MNIRTTTIWRMHPVHAFTSVGPPPDDPRLLALWSPGNQSANRATTQLMDKETARKQGLPPLSPDVSEEALGLDIDNIVPTRGYEMTPMVGLGGSAGCIPALQAFFEGMPGESGMVFVVILHLSPTHVSTLSEMLARSAKMPVQQASDGQKVKPNQIYVIPPGKSLTAVDGHLRLLDFENERGRRTAVDLFFRSLADTHGPHASAIVLSGADGDGAIGIKRIKERGGLTIAQDPSEAEHSSMPRTAIETGMVDWVLGVKQIPDRLLQYYANEQRLKLPPEEGPKSVPAVQPTESNGESDLRDVLAFLRNRTGCDFSYYKRATILRRIGRRMQVNSVEDLPSYLSILRMQPGEAGALLQDLLISVTNFFRDRGAFEALEALVPQLFRNKHPSDSIRVWVPACATGEEAYSIAMLLLEHARKLEDPPGLQVFACDLDEQAIAKARMGFYPEAITADVSEERLQRYFVKAHGGYRVRRELREMVLFASHDLLKDAPFSRMDLISCRNLLIYLDRAAQERVFDTFHFSMKPGGILFLGSSEAVDDGSPMFRVIDKKHRIYVHQPMSRCGLSIPAGPSALLRAIAAQDDPKTTPITHGTKFIRDTAVPFHSTLGQNLDRASLAELHFQMLERLAPPSIIVNAEHDIMHLSEHAGQFLKLSGGQPTFNLLRVVHPLLRLELRTALFRAAESGAAVETPGVPADVEGVSCRVNIRVSPVGDLAPGYLLVVLEQATSLAESRAAGDEPLSAESEPAVRHLERELEHVKLQLRETIERYEASTEELKAGNEELQAMNEELRSATEELETSREELQSINEELTTVNLEMKEKVDELGHANSDLQNLMASTSIATIFLDREFAVMRYTPSAAGIFNLIPGDVGRPLLHLSHHLDYSDLLKDARKVLDTLQPIEREISGNGRWYLARFQPYRTLEDHIGGVVLTLVDITERKQGDEKLRESEERMRLLIESAKDYAIFTTDAELRVDSWNSGAESVFGYRESEILGKPGEILFTPEDRAKGDPAKEVETAAREGRAGNERWHIRKDGSVFYGSGIVSPLRDKAGALRGFVKIMRDLTESKRTQEALRDQMEELRRFNAAAVGRETRMIELKREVNELCQRVGEAARYELKADAE
jgi:two-component system, chemotaxis family, CheB/CheR fusion protein